MAVTKWMAELAPMMPNAVSGTEYGAEKFIEDHRFSPIISDRGSFKAVKAVLEKYGPQVVAVDYRLMAPKAMQMMIVFEEGASGPACHLYRKQP